MSGSSTMRDRISSAQPGRPTNEYTTMVITITVSRKLVPQRTCDVSKRCADSAVSSTSFSYAAIALCSAPWYWKTRLMSFSWPISSR